MSTDESVKTRIHDIKAGDTFYSSGERKTAQYDAHQNLSEHDEPWIVYDLEDDSFFEEDIDSQLPIPRLTKMTFFEKELRRIVAAGCGIGNPSYTTRTCYGKLGDDLIAKMRFDDALTIKVFSSVVVEIINRTEGNVDSCRYRFSDIWGEKQTNNPNIPKVAPYIRKDRKSADIDWYVYQPTDEDIRQLAESIRGYIEVYKR
jgi:hypothetical protein